MEPHERFATDVLVQMEDVGFRVVQVVFPRPEVAADAEHHIGNYPSEQPIRRSR